MSYAKMANAATMTLEPIELQIVTDLIPAPNKTSERKTRTIVRRFPTDTMIGPHTPSKI